MSSRPILSASENWLVAAGKIDPSAPMTLLKLDSGRVVEIPTSLLIDEEIRSDSKSAKAEFATSIIPVIQEDLVITKRAVALETLRVETSVETRKESAQVELSQEHFKVVRIPIDEEVSARSDSRQEGDTTIYPVFEERLVARTALFLSEEIHITRVVGKVTETVEAVLRRDVVDVRRVSHEPSIAIPHETPGV